MLEKHNLVIICKDCGTEFDFTTRDQEFYEQMGFDKPVRCKECREAKKQYRAAIEQERQENENN